MDHPVLYNNSPVPTEELLRDVEVIFVEQLRGGRLHLVPLPLPPRQCRLDAPVDRGGHGRHFVSI